MGADFYGKAGWGLKTTRAAVRATYKETKRWVGHEDGDRACEYDPRTGKKNWRVEREMPVELQRWPEECDVGTCEDREIVLCLSRPVTSEAERPQALRAPSQPVGEQMDAFMKDMMKLGLWKAEDYGLWVWMYVSI